MQACIELRGIRALGCHGAAAEERADAQPFEVDVDVEADVAAAGWSDELADTVDYGMVVAAVIGVVEKESHCLLERLAVRIAEEISAVDARVGAVRVTVRKLHPPVPVHMDTAGVRVTWP